MESDAEDAATPPLEFALESFLEQFLLTNWEGIDWGRPLELGESETGGSVISCRRPSAAWTSCAVTRRRTRWSSSS